MAEKQSKLEKLQQSLYQRGQGARVPRRWSRFTQKKYEEVDDWEHDHKRNDLEEPIEKKTLRTGIPMKLFIFSVVFFIIALIIAAFVIVRGSNNVSSENIDVVVSGPVTVAGGEKLMLQIDITNRNNATLELVDLIIEFPDGTKNPTDTREPLRRIRETLGNLNSGETVSEIVSAVLFGEEGVKKNIMIGIEYRISGSNAIFFKESEYTVQIGTAPVSLIIDMPTEVNSGKEVEITIEAISNSKEVIKNFALMVEYPFGFLFTDADPSPDIGDTLWKIGDLEPQGRRTITITGMIEGQDEEERTFRFSSGILEDEDDREIATTLLDIKRSLAIKRPFVQVGLVLNGDTGDTIIVNPEKTITGIISWQNNLSIPVDDVVIEAVLTGKMIDERTVRVISGFYRSIDNTVIWDKDREPTLAILDPGSSGQLTFEFDLLDFQSGESFNKESIIISVEITGRRIGDSPDTTGNVSSTVAKNVRVASEVRVDARAVYSTGPFVNVGPIPPEAEKETTYTVIWSLTNSANDLVGTEVVASLPDYMDWIGLINPSNENVTYNSVTSEIRWNADLVSSGTGYTQPPKEVAFQISFLPSISQIGFSPVLVGQTTMTAFDTFIGASLRTTDKEVTTAISTDPTYTINDSRVVE